MGDFCVPGRACNSLRAVQRGIAASTYPPGDVPTWPSNPVPNTQTTDQEANNHANV